MTREEAIGHIKDVICENNTTKPNIVAFEQEKEALYVAIKALEQEPKTGHWIVQPSNKEQGERDFIWWKCSECGQVIYSETEKDRKEFHAFCSRCGAKMVEPQESQDT